MNARRIPFQFSTTDPLARQRELEKRFGLQPTCPKMYVDVNNPLLMGGTTPRGTSSPRFQHRVPIFAEGYDQPIQSSAVDSMASIPDKKPNVRVIPIEIEGVDSRPSRHRTYSGPANTMKDRGDDLASERNEASPLNQYIFEDLPKSPKLKRNAEPRIYNIPIQVEGGGNISKSPKKVNVAPKPNSATSSGNVPKSSSKVESPKIDKMNTGPYQNQADLQLLLKKIEDVLTEFKTYEKGVLEFNGTVKDKQYRYLDEMLTRCMLRLDDIDTMGNEEVRLARKSAVKKIQASIDLLESKSNAEPVPQVQETLGESNDVGKNGSNDIEMQDNKLEDNTVDSSENEAKVKEVDSTAIDNKDLSEDSNKIADSDAIEMSEVVQDTMKSTKNTNLCEIQKQEQIEDFAKNEINDVEMDENQTLNAIEVMQSAEEKGEVTEVEMTEIDDSSKEPGEEILCENIETAANINSDCSEQKSDDLGVQGPSIVSPRDAEMEDIQSSLDNIMQNKICNNLSGQDDKCSSSQTEKTDDSLIIKAKDCCNNPS